MAYLPLSTANLPDPVIDPAQGASPEDHFNTVLWTGNGTSQSITGVGFQPDFVWIKSRSGAFQHHWKDVLRGTTKRLSSSETNAEETNTNSLTSFDADGYSLGLNTEVNGGSTTYVGWNWKANGSGVTNNVGSIPSTVSANTTSGFSIVSWTGNATQSTIGHGLNSAPDFLVVKNRDNGASNWNVWHTDLTTDYSLYLNLTNAENPNAPLFFGDGTNMVVPTDSVFTVGSNSQTNGSGNDIIAYCFHSVDGFSKLGSYVGNGSATDSPFVYLGFRPAFVLIKQSSGAGTAWNLWDSKRDGYNLDNWQLEADDSKVENTSIQRMTFLSNGFKIHQTSSAQVNASGQTYIYMAFAEQPIKFSNAR